MSIMCQGQDWKSMSARLRHSNAAYFGACTVATLSMHTRHLQEVASRARIQVLVVVEHILCWRQTQILNDEEMGSFPSQSDLVIVPLHPVSWSWRCSRARICRVAGGLKLDIALANDCSLTPAQHGMCSRLVSPCFLVLSWPSCRLNRTGNCVP